MTHDAHYDVVIIGGRPAGATLAARLGAAGVRVAIFERTVLPAFPGVSTPFLLPHAMALLDQLGLDEADYAHAAPRMHHVALEIGDHVRVRLPIGRVGERAYCYTVDRVRFDDVLWRNLARFDTVHARDGVAVIGFDTDRLTPTARTDHAAPIGVRVRERDSATEQLVSADCVIGADGRGSLTARSFGARVIHQRTDLDTHAYYAFWHGVADYDTGGDALAHIHSSADGWSVVFMPMSEGRTSVMLQAQSALFEACTGTVHEIYERSLRMRPHVWRRLGDAHMVSELRGIKRIGNLFREPGGPGWALVGDAYHQKDSFDAQGIYDALRGAELLAQEIIEWQRGRQSWERALARYGANVWAETRPMFDATMARVKRELYTIPSPLVARTVLRWLLEHPAYQQRFADLLVRRLPPDRLLTPGLMVRALGRGPVSDLVRLVSRSRD